MEISRIEKDYGWNLICFLLIEVFWGIGTGFALFYVTVPAYLSYMNAPKILIAFIQTTPLTFAFVQIFSSFYFAGGKRKRNLFIINFTGCLFLFIISVTYFLWIGNIPRIISVGLFSVMVSLFMFMITLSEPLYMEIMTENTAVRRRGMLLGLRCAVLGITGLVVSFIWAMIFKNTISQANYFMCFLLASCFYSISCFFILMIKDNVDIHGQNSNEQTIGFIKGTKELIMDLLKDPNYRILIFFYICIAVSATIGLSLAIPFARDVLKVAESEITFLNTIFFVTGIIIIPGIGKIADILGYRIVGLFISAFIFIGFTLLISVNHTFYFYFFYVSLCVFSLSSIGTLTNLSVELRQDLKPAKIFTAGMLLPIPFIFVGSTLSGQVIDSSANYCAVFTMCATLSAIAAIGFLLFVREPRKGRIYIIKQITPLW